MNDDDALIQLAKRLGDDPAYIAWLIQLILEISPQTWEELAARLALSPRQLAMLALCRRPSEQKFADEVRQIAAYVEMDVFKLAAFLREWETLDTFRNPGSSQMAARDGKDNGTDDPE
jgi:hypothetical protein